MPSRIPSAAFVLFLAIASTANAEPGRLLWGEDGSPATEATGREVATSVAPGGDGGVFIFGSALGPSPIDLKNGVPLPPTTLREGAFLQRLDGRGRRPWRRDGRQPEEWVDVADDGMASDGAGGVIVAWVDWSTSGTEPNRLQRYDAEGRKVWREDGVPLFPRGDTPHRSFNYWPEAVSDGRGGAIVVWDKGDRPVVGDWIGDGRARIGVFRPSHGAWFLDRSGDGIWSGCAADACHGPFGLPGDVPIVGRW